MVMLFSTEDSTIKSRKKQRPGMEKSLFYHGRRRTTNSSRIAETAAVVLFAATCCGLSLAEVAEGWGGGPSGGGYYYREHHPRRHRYHHRSASTPHHHRDRSRSGGFFETKDARSRHRAHAAAAAARGGGRDDSGKRVGPRGFRFRGHRALAAGSRQAGTAINAVPVAANATAASRGGCAAASPAVLVTTTTTVEYFHKDQDGRRALLPPPPPPPTNNRPPLPVVTKEQTKQQQQCQHHSTRDDEDDADGQQQRSGDDGSSSSSSSSALGRLEMGLFGTYFCNAVGMTLPVVLMPAIAAERAVSVGGPDLTAAASASSFAASAASVATLGGGVGKLVNGFVAQRLGGKRSSGLYLAGLAASSLLLSSIEHNMSRNQIGCALAAIEFFASIQWTACGVVLANHYCAGTNNPGGRFAAGVTALGFASTAGTLFAKTAGAAVLPRVRSWRHVARAGALVAAAGGLLVRTLVSEFPDDRQRQPTASTAAAAATADTEAEAEAASTERFRARGGGALTRENNNKKYRAGDCSADERDRRKAQEDLVLSAKRVLGSRLFWQVGLAHATAFVARTSDRVLGAFFRDATGLPRQICGGLTACMTVGFVHGLQKGRAFYNLNDDTEKRAMLRSSYLWSVLCTVGLAACGNHWFTARFLPSRTVLAAVVAALSAGMASSLSFQFYQIPPMAASAFGRNRAVCLSLLDGLGFFVSAPVWAACGTMVARLGDFGWTAAWTMIAALFALGGWLMMDILPTVLREQQQHQAQT